MRFSLRFVPKILWVGVFLLTVAMSCEDDCADEICAPCPSSRFLIRYETAAGNCDSAFHATGMVWAYDKDHPGTLVRSYSFTDSCTAAFLVQEDLIYYVTGAGISDTIVIDSFEYQPPVNVTECCLCYPIDQVHFRLNDSTIHQEWLAGEYDNVPYVRKM